MVKRALLAVFLATAAISFANAETLVQTERSLRSRRDHAALPHHADPDHQAESSGRCLHHERRGARLH